MSTLTLLARCLWARRHAGATESGALLHAFSAIAREDLENETVDARVSPS